MIRPSTGPRVSPIVLAKKKDEGVRLCIDYRNLNKVARFDAYHMPRIEELIDIVGSSKVIAIYHEFGERLLADTNG